MNDTLNLDLNENEVEQAFSADMPEGFDAEDTYSEVSATSSEPGENMEELETMLEEYSTGDNSEGSASEETASEPEPDNTADTGKSKKKKKEPKQKKVKQPKDKNVAAADDSDAIISESEAARVLKKRDGQKFRPFNFSRKLALLCIVPLIVLCIVTTITSTSVLRNNIEEEIKGSLKIIAVSLEETYSSLYVGDYSSDLNGALFKGETKISGNNALLDALKDNTGYESSFYWNGRAVLTTILRKKGGRINGLPADEEIYARVMNGEEVFTTDTVIEDINYYAYYRPLVNSDGSVVGCLFAAKPTAEVEAMVKREAAKITLYSVIISCVCVAVILLIANGFSRNMVKSKNFLKVLSTGDLTQNARMKSLKRNDELGDIYAISYALQEELKRIVSNIKFSASELAASSDNLLTISQNTSDNVATLYDSVEFISRGASDQADQTSVAAIQISNIGDQIENISNEVSSLAQSAGNMSDAERASTEIIKELNVSNEQMIDSIEKIAEQIEITNSSVQGIRAAVAMIQAITDETDLLSINASIEAAHAGDAGRGFAVVAEQISKLAAQSGNNATEIEKTINTLLEESNLMVQYMEDVKIKIAEQREKLNLTIDQFSVVASGVDSSLTNIQYITNGMDELRKSRDVIMDVISDLSAVSQQYAASTNGTIDAAQTMSNAMETLAEASNKLKKMSDGLYDELQIFKV